MQKQDFFGYALLQKLIQGLGLSLVLLGITGGVGLAASPTQEIITTPPSQIGIVIFLLVAAAIVVERVIELAWNYLEWILVRFVRWRPGDLKTPSYVQFKSGTSLLAALFLGVLVANYSGMHLLDYVQPLIPTFLRNILAEWDIILTGIVIGAGTKPLHDLLGIVTHTKNLLGSSALKQREQAGAALAEGIFRLEQASSSYSVDVPGMGTTRVAAGGRARDEDGRSTGAEERIEHYAEMIHDNLYIGS